MFANFEYEYDELKRDIDLFEQFERESDPIAFELHHDQTIIEPGKLVTSSHSPQKIFTPYHKAWLSEISSNPSLLDTVNPPKANTTASASAVKDLYEQEIPDISDALQQKPDLDREHFRKLWPAGRNAATQRLEHFLKNKVGNYASDRSNPAKDCTSRLSPYLAVGVISVREALSAAKQANGGNAKFDGSCEPGLASWVRELVFREFYRHTMIVTPHTAMNLPKNLKFDFVEWENDEEGWKKWCDGKTGMPFVDAGMRQLAAEAYM